MYGRCKECAKLMNCHKPTGYRFGFCETDYEPKEIMPPLVSGEVMHWKQITSTIWEAEGKHGKFRIERSRGRFWARYSSNDMSFKMPPKSKLSEAKDMCENNEYWE